MKILLPFITKIFNMELCWKNIKLKWMKRNKYSAVNQSEANQLYEY